MIERKEANNFNHLFKGRVLIYIYKFIDCIQNFSAAQLADFQARGVFFWTGEEAEPPIMTDLGDMQERH